MYDVGPEKKMNRFLGQLCILNKELVSSQHVCPTKSSVASAHVFFFSFSLSTPEHFSQL